APGGTRIPAGTLRAGNATALGANASAVNVAAGAVLDLNGITMTATNPLTLAGTGLNGSGPLINSSVTPGTYAGILTLATDITLLAVGGDIVFPNTPPGRRGNHRVTPRGTA